MVAPLVFWKGAVYMASAVRLNVSVLPLPSNVPLNGCTMPAIVVTLMLAASSTVFPLKPSRLASYCMRWQK